MRPTAHRRNARGPRDRQAFEHVRMQAGALCAAGHAQAEIARSLGVARQSLMAVVTLREDLAGAGADSNALSIAGRSLVALHDGKFLLGPQFCAGFGIGLLLGYLMYRSGLVPRGMALLGLIGGPLAFVGGVGVLLGCSSSPRHRCSS